MLEMLFFIKVGLRGFNSYEVTKLRSYEVMKLRSYEENYGMF